MSDAGEATARRARPYDLRWGTPKQAADNFGINAATLKAAWLQGWVRARQGCWISDKKRTQTVYCFEDIHVWMEREAHRVSRDYAATWWTDKSVAELKAMMSEGPYARAKVRRSDIRKDGLRQTGLFDEDTKKGNERNGK